MVFVDWSKFQILGQRFFSTFVISLQSSFAFSCRLNYQRETHYNIMSLSSSEILKSGSNLPLDVDSIDATLSFIKKSKPTLYSYWRSSCSWRVRIALELKNVEYDYVPVHLVKNEQMGKDYVKLNPSEEVPTLCIDGNVLNQSV